MRKMHILALTLEGFFDLTRGIQIIDASNYWLIKLNLHNEKRIKRTRNQND